MGNRASRDDKRRLKAAAATTTTATGAAATQAVGEEAAATERKATTNRFHRNGQRPLVLGHRGAPLLVQENTLASFEKAISMGFEGIELDVCVTKDNVPVIFHDEDTTRLTGQPGTIYDRTYAEVQQLRIQKTLDVDTKGRMITFEQEQPIPTLREVLQLAARTGVVVDIDTHVLRPHWDRRHWGTEIAKTVRETGVVDSVIMSGFDFFMLGAAKEEFPDMTVCYTYDDDMALGYLDQVPDDWWKRHPDISKDGLRPANIPNGSGLLRWIMESDIIGKFINSGAVLFEWTVLDGDIIEKYHKIHHAVGTYTLFPLDTSSVHHFVNDEQAETLISNLLSRKIDWIETDNPLHVRQIIDKINKEVKDAE